MAHVTPRADGHGASHDATAFRTRERRGAARRRAPAVLAAVGAPRMARHRWRRPCFGGAGRGAWTGRRDESPPTPAFLQRRLEARREQDSGGAAGKNVRNRNWRADPWDQSHADGGGSHDDHAARFPDVHGRRRPSRLAVDPLDPLADDVPTVVRRGQTHRARQSARQYNRDGVAAAACAGVGAALCAAAWAIAASSAPPREATQPATPASASAATAVLSSEELYGHRAYAECPQEELTPVAGGGGGVTMRVSAAIQFDAMRDHAAADGVRLMPVSGFRSVAEQHHLYFNVKSQRTQTAAQRAEVSAPPGYSEHHTGYAVDIVEEGRPVLSEDFKHTRAFHWLCNHAAAYHFELSFPEHNHQGVAFEPWHWRYVGDVHALRTFAAATKR